MNSQNITLFLTSAATLFVGAGIGYMVAERRLSVRFDERLEKETADLKTFYTTVPTKKYATPEDAVKDLVPTEIVDALQDYQGVEAGRKPQKVPYHLIGKGKVSDEEIHEMTEPTGPEVVQTNVFSDPDALRGDIYVLTAAEFEENDPDYIQSTLTWYAKDGVLADERDDRIDEIEATIGVKAIQSFGKLSNDPNVVHVRNLVLQLDFEIVRNDSSFAYEVLGEEYVPTERPSGRSG